MISSSEDFGAVFSETFLKRFKKRPSNIKQYVRRAVKDILKNPKGGTPLVGDLSGLWRKKIGVRVLLLVLGLMLLFRLGLIRFLLFSLGSLLCFF